MNFSKFFNILGSKKNAAGTTITNISIQYLGDAHGMDGMQIQNKIFELSIPFQNKTGSDLLAENIKRPDLKIEAINVSAPFELVEVNPKLPISVKYMENTILKLKLKAPSLAYSGPLNISLGDKKSNMIRIQIQKIVAISKNAKTDLEEAPSVLSVQKDQVLKRDIQMYKFLNYGDTVSKIEVNKPFVLSGSEPKVPFKMDKENSYIVSLYLLAPQESYAGPLEISFY